MFFEILALLFAANSCIDFSNATFAWSSALSFFYSNYDKHDQKNKDDRDKSNSDKHNTITLNIVITEDDYYNKSEEFFTLLCLVVQSSQARQATKSIHMLT